MKKILNIGFLCVGLMSVGLAQADQKDLSLSTGIGYNPVNGIELKGRYDINNYWSVQGSYGTGFSLNDSGSSNGDQYNYEVNLKQSNIGVAFHPFSGSFYVKAGYVIGDSYLKGSTQNVQGSGVGADTRINLEQSFMGTIGWVGRNKGLSYQAEIGLISTTAKLDSFNATGTVTDQVVFDNAKADVVKGLANISYLPTASLAVTYNF